SLGTPVIGNEVIRVNNTAPAGPGISLAVSPGDKLSAEVWAYYESGSSYNSMIAVSTMVTAIAGAFGGVSGAPGEAGQIYDDINSGVSTYIVTGIETSLPSAYPSYFVFDANHNPTGQKGFFRVTTASNMAKAKIPMPEITIEHPGFVYIFVYNRSDSPNWVFFDEMVVNHEHSSIVPGADYYPFGLVMNGREITDEPYRWGYQGQYAQENDSTGWNEFQLRMYDARFGRWLSVDPYNQYNSPYVGMGNNPISMVDPDGGVAGGGGLLWKWVANPTTVDNLAGYWTRTLLGKVVNIANELAPIAINVALQQIRSDKALQLAKDAIMNRGAMMAERQFVVENYGNPDYKSLARDYSRTPDRYGDASDDPGIVRPGDGYQYSGFKETGTTYVNRYLGSDKGPFIDVNDPETGISFTMNRGFPQVDLNVQRIRKAFVNSAGSLAPDGVEGEGFYFESMNRTTNAAYVGVAFKSRALADKFYNYYYSKGKAQMTAYLKKTYYKVHGR